MEALQTELGLAYYRAFNEAKHVMELDAEGIILNSNELLQKTLGYSAVELSGKHHRIICDENQVNWGSCIENSPLEIKCRAKNGKEVWFHTIFFPLKNDDGSILKILKIATDISSVKEELVARTAIMNMTSIVSESDLKGDILSVNDKFCETSQYDRDELIGKPHNTTRHPDVPKETFKLLWGTIGRGKMFRGIIKNRKKDGTPYYVDAVIAPIMGENGKPKKYLGVRYDITETEIERHNMKGVINAINASYAYIEFNTDGNILSANEIFQDVMLYKAEEILGKHHRIFVEAEFAKSPAYNTFWEELRAGKSQSNVFKRITKAGQEVWLQAVYSPVMDEMGRVYKIVKIATNVTSQVEVEKTVTRMANEFSSNAMDISNRSTSVAQGAQALGATTEEMNAAIEELTASINSIAQNSKNTDLVAKSTFEEAEIGSKAINKAIEAMDLISKSSEDISEIVKVISEIANQTNLLAFNAAIEAARAGEHGLGFSVVADEVRKLAERSSLATKEISKLINESVKRVAQGSEISKQAGVAFEKIVIGVNKTTQAISEVSCAAEEQLVAAKEMSSAIEQVAEETEKAATSSTAIANATKGLTQGAEELKLIVAKFRA